MYAFQLLPVNWAGVGLIAVGSAMMIGEAFLPSFGVLGVGGIIAFVLGGLFLTDTGIPGFDLSIPFLIGLAVVSAGLIMAIGVLAARVHKRKVVSGREDMLGVVGRSEEHTSELQSLMRISYAVFCLKKKNITSTVINN